MDLEQIDVLLRVDRLYPIGRILFASCLRMPRGCHDKLIVEKWQKRDKGTRDKRDCNCLVSVSFLRELATLIRDISDNQIVYQSQEDCQPSGTLTESRVSWDQEPVKAHFEKRRRWGTGKHILALMMGIFDKGIKMGTDQSEPSGGIQVKKSLIKCSIRKRSQKAIPIIITLTEVVIIVFLVRTIKWKMLRTAPIEEKKRLNRRLLFTISLEWKRLEVERALESYRK